MSLLGEKKALDLGKTNLRLTSEKIYSGIVELWQHKGARMQDFRKHNHICKAHYVHKQDFFSKLMLLKVPDTFEYYLGKAFKVVPR